MKYTKQLLIGVLTLVIATSTSGVVLAQAQTQTESPDTPVTTQTRPSREQRIQQVERTLERCEQIASRLEARKEKTNEIKANHVERYERMTARIDAVIASAESREYDTAGLIAAKTTVTTAITAYASAFDAYSLKLTETSELSCEESASAYGAAIVESRDALEAVRTAGATVKSTFRQTVVPELQEYKAWLEENASSTEETAQ